MKADCVFQIAFIELNVLKCVSLWRGKSFSQKKENLYDSLALREILVQGRTGVCVCVCVWCVCVWCVCGVCVCVCGVCVCVCVCITF